MTDNHKTDIKILTKTMRILAVDILSGDGIANAAIAEAADRLEEQAEMIDLLAEMIDLLEEQLGDQVKPWSR